MEGTCIYVANSNFQVEIETDVRLALHFPAFPENFLTPTENFSSRFRMTLHHLHPQPESPSSGPRTRPSAHSLQPPYGSPTPTQFAPVCFKFRLRVWRGRG